MAYKIVTKNRYGILSLYHEKHSKRLVQNLLEKYPFLEKILPKYEVGKWVHSIKNSPGIFCFKTKKDAEIYLNSYFLKSEMDKLMIIKVLGKNRQLCSYRLNTINIFYLFDTLVSLKSMYSNILNCTEISDDVVLYEKIKVLE